VRIENGLDILQLVTGDGRDLRHTGACDREANHRRAAQIMELRPSIPARSQAFAYEVRKPSDVQGRP